MALPGELPDGRVPLFLVTGFLGSGKTTLLNHLLAQPGMAGTAVLINEFGEVGIDNLLISEIRDELILLKSGCVCCQYLGDLSFAIKDLFAKREAEEIPRFDRLVLETTGLADPMRLVDTVMNDPAMSLLVYLDSVITTVDAVLGPAQLRENPEPSKQIALADRIVLTKVDIATPEGRAEIEADIRRLNPMAPIRPCAKGQVDPEELLGAGTLDDGARGAKLSQWLRPREDDAGPAPSGHSHLDSVKSFTVRLAEPLPPKRFSPWFSKLIRAEGKHLLRVKGLVQTTEDERPLVVQSVQWILCPTHWLAAWPDESRETRLVFIGRDMPPELEASIRADLESMTREEPAAPSAPVAPARASESPAVLRYAASFWKRLTGA